MIIIGSCIEYAPLPLSPSSVVKGTRIWAATMAALSLRRIAQHHFIIGAHSQPAETEWNPQSETQRKIEKITAYLFSRVIV